MIFMIWPGHDVKVLELKNLFILDISTTIEYTQRALLALKFRWGGGVARFYNQLKEYQSKFKDLKTLLNSNARTVNKIL